MKELLTVLLVWIFACVLVDAGRSFANSAAKAEILHRDRMFGTLDQDWAKENL